MSSLPPSGTIQRWACDYILSTDLDHKLSPPAPPTLWEGDPPPRRLDAPGRPQALDVRAKAERSIRPGAFQHAHRRAQAFHSFLHHELQAAELMAWAILAFPDSPEAFRRGLLKIVLDEIRHMQMYRKHLLELGSEVGDFPVRDWFWQRIPHCQTPAGFVAAMGIGLEGCNPRSRPAIRRQVSTGRRRRRCAHSRARRRGGDPPRALCHALVRGIHRIPRLRPLAAAHPHQHRSGDPPPRTRKPARSAARRPRPDLCRAPPRDPAEPPRAISTRRARRLRFATSRGRGMREKAPEFSGSERWRTLSMAGVRLTSILIAMTLAPPLCAQDWPQWRFRRRPHRQRSVSPICRSWRR